MLNPNQFRVNEAWIAFKLNDGPIHTEADGDFDFIALMDAASCFILSFGPVPICQMADIFHDFQIKAPLDGVSCREHTPRAGHLVDQAFGGKPARGGGVRTVVWAGLREV